MGNLLFLGVPILKHIRVITLFSEKRQRVFMRAGAFIKINMVLIVLSFHFYRNCSKFYARSIDPDQCHLVWYLIWVCTFC